MTRVTDALSATIVAAIIWTVGRKRGLTLDELLRPTPFFAGVISAVAIELGFARWPTTAGRLWRKPIVRILSPIGVIVGTFALSRRSDATPFAITLGGLAGYFGLLAGITSGMIPESATWFGDNHD